MADEEVFEENVEESSDKIIGDKIQTKFLESAYDKAKDIAELAFSFGLSVVLLFFQTQQCHFPVKLPSLEDLLGIDDLDSLNDTINAGNQTLNETISMFIGNITGNETVIASIEGLTCDVKNFENATISLCIAIAIAIYGVCIASIVLVHAARLKDTGKSRVEDIYMWTDQIPILDSIIEIPIAFYFAPFNTLFLWGLFMACISGLVIIVLEGGKGADGDDPASLVLTSILIGYHIYKMTGNISQYYVIYKTSTTEDSINEKLDTYMISQKQISVARLESSKSELSIVSSQRQLSLARQMSSKSKIDLPSQNNTPIN